ncbi:MAG TPA: hypothetical protein VNK82_05575 [Terriglobales bacterium]|nr:hypothetical protein [Terriglobales bacterium]
MTPRTPSPPRWLHPVLFALALSLGLLRTLAYRDLQGGDSISYLDIATFYARGDFAQAVNVFWSPLYSWLLAGWLAVLRPQPDWEFTAVSSLGFVIYLAVIPCFVFFWRALDAWRNAEANGSDSIGLPPTAWWLLGSALFLWATLDLGRLTFNPADLLLSGCVYLAAGVLVRLRAGDLARPNFLLLGLALGLGYLAKTALLPLSAVFPLVAVRLVGTSRAALRRFLPAIACWLVIALPWIAAISLHQYRLTIGESGPINYAWHVNRAPMFYWQGSPPGSGKPEHPPRQVFARPAMYEFAEPVPGTFPVWFDPSYWNQGLKARFDRAQQWDTLRTTLPQLLNVLRTRPDLLLACLVLLLAGGAHGFRRLARGWFLLFPAAAALAMYSLVHLERRYVAAFVVLIWAAVFSCLRFPAAEKLARASTALAVLILAATLAPLAANLPAELRDIRERPERVHWRVAQELERRGARPGDRILMLGGALWNAPLARLARVQIAAEIPWTEAPAFWSAGSPTQAAVMDAASAFGIRLLVADCGQCSPPPACTRIPNTSRLASADQRSFYVCDLDAFRR